MQKSLNENSQEDLTLLKTMAGLFFSPADIAMALEVDVDELNVLIDRDNFSSKIYQAFWGGRLQGEVDLRTGIMKMAKAGSTPAQAMAMDLLRLSKLKMIAQ